MTNQDVAVYIDKNNENTMLAYNIEGIDIYADVKSETEDTIIFENFSIRIANRVFLKLTKDAETKLGFLFAGGMLKYDNFVFMIQQMLNTTKKLIFPDVYTDKEYPEEITI